MKWYGTIEALLEKLTICEVAVKPMSNTRLKVGESTITHYHTGTLLVQGKDSEDVKALMVRILEDDVKFAGNKS